MVGDIENPKAQLINGKGMELQTDNDYCSKKNIKSLHEAVLKPTIDQLNDILGKVSSQNISTLINKPDEQNGYTPLLLAVNEAKHPAVELLLNNGAHVNARNDNGHSALHFIAYNLTSDDCKFEALLKCADHILKQHDIDLEAHNDSGYTPLRVAANFMVSNKGIIRSNLEEFCKKLCLAGASTEQVNDNVRINLQQFKDLNDNNQNPPKRPLTSQLLDLSFMKADSDIVQKFVQKNSKNIDINCPVGSKNLLFKAIDNLDLPCVKVLLDNNANPLISVASGETSLERAAAKGHSGIFESIIQNIKNKSTGKKADLRIYTFRIFQKLFENSKNISTDPEINFDECIQLLFHKDVLLNVNQDGGGQTALHKAAAFNNQGAISKLLANGSYIGSRRKVAGQEDRPVLEAISSTTLEKAMDDCMWYNSKDENERENINNPNYVLTLDYGFLIPPSYATSNSEEINEVECLMEINESKQHRKTLTHPLIQTLLYAKWRKALPLYFANLLIYLFFVIMLTLYVYKLMDLRILQLKYEKTNQESIKDILKDDISSCNVGIYAYIAILIPLIAYMIIREIFQIVNSFKTYYKNIENYLEWFLIIAVFVLCIAPLNLEATRHLSAWTMIVAWYEFVLILGRAPFLAIYITMLRAVSWNFLKVITLYSFLIFAFTISFNIILQPIDNELPTQVTIGSKQPLQNGENNTASVADNEEEEDGFIYSSFWETLPKAIVMATGEFEYGDLRNQLSKKEILLFTSAVLLFLVFLFLVFLVLMNVMNGLAVTDTADIRDEAVLHSLSTRLELVYLVELLYLHLPKLRCCLPDMHLLSGNNRSSGSSPCLKVQINSPKDGQRLIYGEGANEDIGQRDRKTCKLNDETTIVLKCYRQQQLEESDPVGRCLEILKELHKLSTTSTVQQRNNQS